MIYKYQNFMLIIFQIVAPEFESFNNRQNFTTIRFILRLKLKIALLVLEFKKLTCFKSCGFDNFDVFWDLNKTCKIFVFKQI